MQRLDSKKLVGIVIVFLVLAAIAFYLVLSEQSPNNKDASRSEALYGGLLAQSSALAKVKRGKALSFPDDHQAHPNYAIEWWYFTAYLNDTENPKDVYGLQYTLFRFNSGNRQANEYADGQIYMAHASLHTPSDHVFIERFSHGGMEHAGVFDDPLNIRMDDWIWQSTDENLLPATLSMTLPSGTANVQVALELKATGPFVLHGDNGFSQKTPSQHQASYYYSQPFIQVQGSIDTGTNKVKVAGKGWFDHEWTSQLLGENASGWDWFSIHFDSGEKLMAFRMRLTDTADFFTATWITSNGNTETLASETFVLEPIHFEYAEQQDKNYPTGWQLAIPHKGVDVQINAQKKAQWNTGRFSYYEGAINISGSHPGVGFMELTGY